MEEAKRRCLALVGGGNERREGLTPRRGRSEKYAILNNFLASFGAVYSRIDSYTFNGCSSYSRKKIFHAHFFLLTTTIAIP